MPTTAYTDELGGQMEFDPPSDYQDEEDARLEDESGLLVALQEQLDQAREEVQSARWRRREMEKRAERAIARAEERGRHLRSRPRRPSCADEARPRPSELFFTGGS